MSGIAKVLQARTLIFMHTGALTHQPGSKALHSFQEKLPERNERRFQMVESNFKRSKTLLELIKQFKTWSDGQKQEGESAQHHIQHN